jgi:hypothetical protein
MELLVTYTLKKVIHFFLLIVTLSSCAIQKRHYHPGYYINFHNHSAKTNNENTNNSKEFKKNSFQKPNLTANETHTDSSIKRKSVDLPSKLNTAVLTKTKTNSTAISKQKNVVKKIRQKHNTNSNASPPGMIDYSFILYAIGGLGAILITAMIIGKVPLIIVAVVFVFFLILLIGIYFLMKHFDLI